MAYNLNGFNQSTYIGFTQGINDLVGSTYNVSFFAILLGVVFCVLFFALMKSHKTEDAALATSFVCLLIGVMFVFASMLSFNYLWYLLAIFIGTLIIKVILEFN